MAKRRPGSTLEDSLLEATRRNDPKVLAEYEKANSELRKVSKQAELEGLMNALNQIRAELAKTPPAKRARVDFFKRKEREAETAIKNWQALNGIG